MDSWHRTGSNVTDTLKRYMLKLHYVRMEQPCVQGRGRRGPRPAAARVVARLAPRRPCAPRFARHLGLALRQRNAGER